MRATTYRDTLPINGWQFIQTNEMSRFFAP